MGRRRQPHAAVPALQGDMRERQNRTDLGWWAQGLPKLQWVAAEAAAAVEHRAAWEGSGWVGCIALMLGSGPAFLSHCDRLGVLRGGRARGCGEWGDVG